jgi:hypothetical protein
VPHQKTAAKASTLPEQQLWKPAATGHTVLLCFCASEDYSTLTASAVVHDALTSRERLPTRTYNTPWLLCKAVQLLAMQCATLAQRDKRERHNSRGRVTGALQCSLPAHDTVLICDTVVKWSAQQEGVKKEVKSKKGPHMTGW